MQILVAVLCLCLLYLVLRGVPLAVGQLRLALGREDLRLVSPVLPSWAQDPERSDKFIGALVTILRQTGLSEARIVAGLNNHRLRHDVYLIAATMEAQGANFAEQQFAAADLAADLLAVPFRSDQGLGAQHQPL